MNVIDLNERLAISNWALFVCEFICLAAGLTFGFLMGRSLEIARATRLLLLLGTELKRDAGEPAAETPAAREAPHFGYRLKVDDTEVELSAPTLADLAAMADWHGQSVDVKG